MPFGCTKICNNSKRTKTRRNKVIEPTTISNDLPQIVPYHIHNQVCYQQKRLCLLGHFEDVFYLLGIYKSIHTHTHTHKHTHKHTHTHITVWPLFLWMGFNCLKARATSRRQFTFYHATPFLSIPGQHQSILL